MAPSKAKKPNKSTKTLPAQEVSRPGWPAFKPLLPASDLSLTTLVEKQIVLIRNFWTSTLCKNYVSFLSSLPLTTTPGKPKKGDALRFNDRFQTHDPLFANRLWIETGLRELVCGGGDVEETMSDEEREALWGGKVLGLNPNIRIYRYTKGQFFDQHYDESNLVTIPTGATSTPGKTAWTVLLYLTSAATGCKGGETVFHPGDMLSETAATEKEIAVSLETGMVLMHKHGRDCMLHEGREVLEGEKWLIRTDLCVKR